MKWCGLKDDRNEIQKMAELINCKLFFDDNHVNELSCDVYTLNL